MEATKTERPEFERHKFRDFHKLLPRVEVRTIFDVGANVGKTVAQARRFYPESEIYAFEPVKASYEEMVSLIGPDDKGVHTFNAAVGARPGEGFITAEGTRPQNRLVEANSRRQTQPVQILAGDEFCESHGIPRINFLKIDTEGHDLDVLRGFQKMLGEERIDLLQVEAGMTAGNNLHVPLDRFQGYLEPMGYSLFRIYEQKGWRKVGGPVLGFANPVFVSESVAAAHMG
jgi:FkbM family methyltransferase